MRVGRIALIVFAACAIATAAVWMVTAPHPAYSTDDSALDQEGDPAKGRLIFAAGDCASCHAQVGQPDRLRLGGGLHWRPLSGRSVRRIYPRTRSMGLGRGKPGTSLTRC